MLQYITAAIVTNCSISSKKIMAVYNNNNDSSSADNTNPQYQIVPTYLRGYAGSAKPAVRGFCIRKMHNNRTTFLEPDYMDADGAMVEVERLKARV
jgi:hypothetical protein